MQLQPSALQVLYAVVQTWNDPTWLSKQGKSSLFLNEPDSTYRAHDSGSGSRVLEFRLGKLEVTCKNSVGARFFLDLNIPKHDANTGKESRKQ